MRPGEGVVACIFPQENQHWTPIIVFGSPQTTIASFVHYFLGRPRTYFLGGGGGQEKKSLWEKNICHKEVSGENYTLCKSSISYTLMDGKLCRCLHRLICASSGLACPAEGTAQIQITCNHQITRAEAGQNMILRSIKNRLFYSSASSYTNSNKKPKRHISLDSHPKSQGFCTAADRKQRLFESTFASSSCAVKPETTWNSSKNLKSSPPDLKQFKFQC